jgi:class 3 adenylate cyclase/tetratricopeptide (TPR) repeat protein
MGCPSCGAENPAVAKFCEQCGARLARRCPSCGHEVSATARFCLECGQRLEAAPAGPPASSGAPTPSPGTYTPRHLAEKILASRAGLEGERKQVTVLFADIVGSTELIQDLDPEDAQRLLDGVVQRMMEAVHRYEGTVSRLMGDGLMALFGAPIGHEDHAVRACYAALAMQDGIRRYADELRREHGLEVEVRVGLNSGEVIVRLISDDLHMDYTAMGQTVHLASRMEQLARASTTRLTARTLALVEGYVRVRSLGPVPVKGLPEPLEAFELIGATAIRTRLQAAAARGLTRFVGRQAEMEALHAVLERARSGHGEVAALVGEPGVGKSRLVWELTHSHRTQGWAILESGSVSYGKATSYLPVIDLLKAYCRIERQEDARAVREKVTGKLLTLDRALEAILPPLLTLLDIPIDDADWDRLDPPQRRRQTIDAVKRLLLRESREQPLLLVFEDLHWIDTETQAVLDSLVESLPTAQILLLVNYRPEYTHGWGNRGYYTQLRIDPLGQDSAEELLASLLGEDPSVGSVRPLLLERTGGNPFFLEECVRSLVETAALVSERGGYRLGHDLASIQVPSTVQAILAARIDRLPPGQKRLLQTAAVVGKDVPLALLEAIAGLSVDDLQRGLAQLQAAEFLYEASLFPEPEYTFKHALTHEVTYTSLLQERRRALHERVMNAIERLYPGRLDERVEVLAHHALNAESWQPALTYSRQAGARATERVAPREAMRHLEQALLALSHLPEGRDNLERGFDIRLELRQAYWVTGGLQRSLTLLREAEGLAGELADARRLARARVLLTRVLWTLGENDAAIETGQQLEASAEAPTDPSIRMLAAYHLAWAHSSRGDFREALADCNRVIEALHGNLLHERFGLVSQPAVSARGMRAWCLAVLGETQLAAAAAEDTIRVADESNHLYSQDQSLAYVAESYIIIGQAQAAASLLERLVVPLEQRGFRAGHTVIGSVLGAAYAHVGRYVEALDLLEASVAQYDSPDQIGRAVPAVVRLSEAYLLAGRIEAAAERAWRAIELSRPRGLRTFEAYALRVLGEVATRRGSSDVEKALTHFCEGLALADELGMRPLQAHCHLGLGKLYRRTDRLDEARAELTTAVAMLSEMRMAFWLPEAEGGLAEAGG